MPLIWSKRRNERISNSFPWSTVTVLHRGLPLGATVKISKPIKSKSNEAKNSTSLSIPNFDKTSQSSSVLDSNQSPEERTPSPAKKRKIHRKKDDEKRIKLNDKPILGPPPTLKLREKWSN